MHSLALKQIAEYQLLDSSDDDNGNELPLDHKQLKSRADQSGNWDKKNPSTSAVVAQPSDNKPDMINHDDAKQSPRK